MTQPGTVGVTGPVAPKNAAEKYPAHDSIWGKGGYREVDDITARDAIPSERQRVGMLVWVADRGDGQPETYRLTVVGDPGTYVVAFSGVTGEWTDAGGYLYPADGATEKVSIGTTTAPTAAAGSDPGAFLRVESGHIEIQGVNSGAWDGAHFVMGSYHFWVDASGRLRVKNGVPTSDTDGGIVGMQS